MATHEIGVHLYGRLRRFAPQSDAAGDSVVHLQVASDETLRAIAARIGIAEEEIGRNVFLDGELSSLDREVGRRGRLALFPPDMNLLYRWYFRRHEGGEA